MTAVFEGKRWIQEPNGWLRLLGIAGIVLGIALTALMVVARTGAYGIGSPFFVLGILAQVLGAGTGSWPKLRNGAVRADETGVAVDGVLRMPRASVARAYVQPLGHRRPVVRLHGKRGTPDLDVVVSDVDEGTRILEALELDVAHRAVAFPGASPLYASIARQVGTGVAFVFLFLLAGFFTRLLGPAVFAFLPFVAFLPILCAMIPSRITVGADGVLTGWLGFERFHSFEEFPDVMPYGNGVALLSRSGKRVNVATTPARRRNPSYADVNRAAVEERIREAQRAFLQHRATNAEALVARSGRTTEDWVEALRALAVSDDYREAAVPREALWRIAEDPAAEPTARAGAAVALRGRIDEADRARLRVAAESSVSPKLRVALEAAATDGSDDGELHAALEGLEETAGT
jgi:hypothetical protein